MGKVAFKQADLERIFRASKRSGVPTAIRIDKKTGELVILPVDAVPATVDPSTPTGEEDLWEGFDAD